MLKLSDTQHAVSPFRLFFLPYLHTHMCPIFTCGSSDNDLSFLSRDGAAFIHGHLNGFEAFFLTKTDLKMTTKTRIFLYYFLFSGRLMDETINKKIKKHIIELYANQIVDSAIRVHKELGPGL
jgi:hypothetical protein